MEKKYVIKNFVDGTYLQQDREGWGEEFSVCEFDSLEDAVDMVALQPSYGNFTIEIIYKNYDPKFGGYTGVIGVDNISWTNTNKLNNGGNNE